jgi:hypothetical protein
MTQAKKLKKAIRARSRKTGESYTAARRQLLLARRPKAGSPVAQAAEAPVPRRSPAPRKPAASSSPVTDANILKKTGHGLDHWFAVLDAFGAAAKGHTASARHLYDDHGVPGWYTQAITVAYERARGLRAVNQNCAGKFQVSVSRVMPASATQLVDLLSRPDKRAAWLQAADPSLRQALEAAFKGPKAGQVKVKDENNAQLRYRWDGRTVQMYIVGKPNGKASLVVDNQDLPGPEAVDARRALWSEALDGLRAQLQG